MKANTMDPQLVEKVLNSEAKFASFRAQIAVSKLPHALDQDSWPENVCVRRYYAQRGRQQQQREEAEGDLIHNEQFH